MLKPRHQLHRWIVAGFLLAVLGGGMAARWLPRRKVVMTLRQSLALHVPADNLGWTVRDELHAATEWRESDAGRAPLERLRRSHLQPAGRSVSRFTSPTGRPASRAQGFAGEQTPDNCWPVAGCHILERRSEMKLVAGERKLLDGEWRRFRMSGGTTTEVVWWHIVGGHFFHFEQWSPLRWLRDAVHELRLAGCNQYLVRITTAQPISDVLTDPAFQAIIARFPLGGVLRTGDRNH